MLVLLHLPIRDRLRWITKLLVVANLFVIAEQIVPFITALILAPQTPKLPAVILHPFPAHLLLIRAAAGPRVSSLQLQLQLITGS
jgi:hypothetical protein